ncbi:serine/threonine-protein kinase [Pengzhenrongella frigida]|uniref:non-specific serine/threonine protein kinase n=1 Tax=Pengzhenrongella frigida TaxID=1259133 RepID=A0A4Q5MZ19_9MICO|nr:serine/threonine-protein kinase [Cellulomonas sp. HLT2-17]RYV50926.1 serine/threonine protein kinase [Cellulomonas sp. HLT2-17]
MSDIACSQPGCTGTILDGYCDVCGTPGGAPPSPVVAASVRTAAVHTPAVHTAGAGQVTGSPAAPAGTDSAASTMSRASNRLASTAMGSARTGGTQVTLRRGTTSTRLRAARLGAGLTTIPPQPAVDASKALMVNPEVAPEKRFCPTCGSPVGRPHDDSPGRTEGFCPQCRSPFSFTPKLQAGDLVGGQYEVAGALAHGGLGWIYLARDRNVSNRWVVLKGLLNAGDADAVAAAIAERQFLAQVEHPLIVEIYNFVTHEGAGYIVMEYIGGTSLKSLLKERMKAAGRYDPLPLDQAIAYVLEILPAFQYLHDLGLVYCDFKPDNIIQVGDDVRLIDLGGVRRLQDVDSAIYGTVGYQAPEVPEVGTSIASDIYTIGRTLLVLAMEFRGYQSTYLTSLPAVADTPLFQKYDSFYRLVAKACAPDAADRFASAAELRVQLLGVLREVVVTDRPDDRAVRHAPPSLLFTPPNVSDSGLAWPDLPELVVDTSDPQVGWLATVSVVDPAARLDLLAQAPERSPEVLLHTGSAALAAHRPDVVDAVVDELLTADPWEWRAVWLQGLKALDTRDGDGAQAAFNAVYGQVPGELAPKLALALACELRSELDIAEALYTTCARSDASYTAPAAFAMARIRSARADIAGAVAALDLVPPTSRAFPEARRQRAGLLADSGGGLPALAAAMASVDGVSIDPHDRSRLTAQVLETALGLVLQHGPQPTVAIGGLRAAEPALRDGLEQTYRELASMAATAEERVALVDSANAVRRWTLR